MKKNEARKESTALVKSSGDGVEKSYAAWIADLKHRYRATQIKAAVAVNSALIEFYWNLGKDIAEKYPGEVYGSKFFDKLGVDLRRELPGASGFSKVNLIYCLKFYELYSAHMIVPQPVEQSVKSKRGASKMPQVAAKCVRPQAVDDNIVQQVVAQLVSVPWGHHRTIIDKCKGERDKALFYVRRTIQNGWSRNSLLNWLSTDLYEREGKAQTNFELTMPSDDCDLARHICSALAFARLGALESCAPLARRLRARDTSCQPRAVSCHKLFVRMSKEIAYNSKVTVCNSRQSMI